MLGILLESRSKAQRRSGGAVLSVAVHVAIIGAAVAGTVQGTPAPHAPEPAVIVQFAPPPPHAVARQVASNISAAIPSLRTDVVVRHIDAPTTVPISLPAFDAASGAGSDSIVVGGPPIGAPGARSVIDGEPSGGGSDWNASELMMHMLAPAKPRYPESLRAAGVEGRVLVRFTVDTVGRIDMGSVRVLDSTHDLFSRAVRDALSNFRFRPAEVGGRKVAALAEMPFEFRLR